MLGLVLILGLVAVPAARAQGPVDIQSSGPLTDIWIGDDLTCQVNHVGDGGTYEFYYPGSTTGNCGTLVSANGELFGFLGSAWIPDSQTGVTGAGTPQNPYQVITTVDAEDGNGPIGLTLTETDSYVVGNEYYRTDITLTNTSSDSTFTNLRLYHAADCYLQGSDEGYGFVASSNGAVACAQNANNTPPALVEEFEPLNGGSSHYVEGFYATVFSDVGSQTDLPDTCDCTMQEDNGTAINWDIASLGAGQQSSTFSMLSNFSPSGATSFISAAGVAPLSGQVSAPVSGTVATFTDPDSSDAASDFSATINWGDGASSAGTISGGNGAFAVAGSHTYAAPGAYTITVGISRIGSGSSTTTVNDSASITSAPSPVTTGVPTVSSSTAAGLTGSVDPGGLPTTAFFQYGLDPKYTGGGPLVYTQSTPAQSVGSDFSSHALSASISGLVPNALYHVRLVAINSAGTTFGPDLTFTTAQAPAPSSPTLGQTFNLAPVSGLVLIKINGMFVPLTGLVQIPKNTEINALHGTLKLVTAVPGNPSGARDAATNGKKHKPKVRTQTGNFGGAIFKLNQAAGGASKGLVTLSIVESAFNGAPSYATCKKGKTAGDASTAAVSSKVLQLLHASAHGKFKTSGRYSAATVRGTAWTVADRCDGTLTHDITDSVAVTDFVRHKTIILHAGQSYLAAPKK